ncbi:MAG: transglutaminase-like cysteine peptidase [Magnetococcales bacterium]|nr:transglutaminase-like cysteine peptidase [Magnetococcales bacterium]
MKPVVPRVQTVQKSTLQPFIWLLSIVLLFFLLPGSHDAIAGKKKKRLKLFETKEFRSRNIKTFKKWRFALDRYSKELSLQTGNCKETSFNKCHYQKWLDFLETLKGKSQEAQIREINTFVNKAKYVTDQKNWGVKDYWESPGEFLNKFGDCEDFSIIKYLSLKKVGFTAKQLRIVAVTDSNLKIGHSILAVYLEDRILILDNQIKQVVDHSSVHHYKPVYSINENFWWRHSEKKARRKKKR